MDKGGNDMIKLEVDSTKKGIRDSFIIRANEPFRMSVDVSETGHVIVYGYQGTEDDVEQDPVVWYDSENEINVDMEADESETV